MVESVTFDSLKDREVINVNDGKRLGYVCDLSFDIFSGRINAIIVPGECNFLGISKGENILIPWECIERIGDDIIIVKEPGPYQRCPRRVKRRLNL